MTMEQHTVTDTPAGPYATAAETYYRSGWSPLPLPIGKKAPVPTGWTGAAGGWPSYPDIHSWIEERGDGNIALRLPPHVIGLDCDHYGGKPGGAVLHDLETRLGALPATWRTTSRDDGISGIRLYRIPEGLRWPGVLGPGIETIRTEHRYAVTWPSIHPTGSTYRWITPDGAIALGVVPTPDDLPDLPDAWVAHFTRHELSTEQARAELDGAAIGGWVQERGQGTLCRHMTTALTRAQADLHTASSRHDAALSATNRLTWLAGEGHTGAAAALQQLRAGFLSAVAGDRDPQDAAAEWERMVAGAVLIAAAAHPAPIDLDPCLDPFAGLIAKDSPWTPTPAPTAGTSAPSASHAGSPSTGHASADTQTGPTSTTVASGASAAPSQAAMGADASPTPLRDEADDLTELQIRRNQATAQELERIRAQRAAQRLLEVEDEDQAIADRVRRRILDDRAHLEYKRQTQPPAPPFDAGTLADILERPADPPMRVEGLIPWSGSALVVAQRKTGKTTLLLNYARALLTGERFLGEFDVIALPEDARVAFLNYEVSAAQLARWAHDAGIPGDRLFLVNLRGRRNPLGHPDDRAALAAALREQNVQALIVDPFGRAYTGVSQNDNGEVQAFLVGLEEFARSEVGALDLMLATHAGWDGERTRGASALEDWGDVIITLTRDQEDEEKRFMKAMGRDVDVPEDELVMDERRTLTRTGNGSRKQAKGHREAAELAVYAIRAARENPGCSKAQMALAIKNMDDAPVAVGRGSGDTNLKNAIAYAEKQGRLRVERGLNGRGHRHFEVDPTSTTTTTTQPPRNGGVPTTTTPVYRGGGGGTGLHRPSGLDGLIVDRHTGEVSG